MDIIHGWLEDPAAEGCGRILEPGRQVTLANDSPRRLGVMVDGIALQA